MLTFTDNQTSQTWTEADREASAMLSWGSVYPEVQGSDSREHVKVVCPFPDHADTDASCALYRGGTFYCFGCGQSGGMAKFLAMSGTISDWGDALKAVQQKAGIRSYDGSVVMSKPKHQSPPPKKQGKDEAYSIRKCKEVWSKCHRMGDEESDVGYNYLLASGWDEDGMSDEANLRYISYASLKHHFGNKNPYGFTADEVAGFLVWGLTPLKSLWRFSEVEKLQYLALDSNSRKLKDGKRNSKGTVKGYVWEVQGNPGVNADGDRCVFYKDEIETCVVGESQRDILLAYQKLGADAGVSSQGKGNLPDIAIPSSVHMTVVSDPGYEAQIAAAQCLRRHLEKGGQGQIVGSDKFDFAECVEAGVRYDRG